MMFGKDIALVAASYLLGCLTAGYYWVLWRTGRDIRQIGSGSVGAKNVARITGRSGFLATSALDCLKGFMAVEVARLFELGPNMTMAALLAVVVGHNWPVQLRFRGGKGICTSLGALLAYDPLIAGLLLAAFLAVFLLVRKFTLSGLFAFVLSPLLAFLWGLENTEVITSSLLATLVLIAHRKNIREEFARFSGHPEPEERTSPRVRPGRLHHEL